jgi:hypothetical protein
VEWLADASPNEHKMMEAFKEFKKSNRIREIPYIYNNNDIKFTIQRINNDSQNFYSVITAFPKGKPRGTRIGSVAL